MLRRRRAVGDRGEPLTLAQIGHAAALGFMPACATSNLEFVPIPVDQAGFAERLRRACELGKGASIEGVCTVEAVANTSIETDASFDSEDTDRGDDGDDGAPVENPAESKEDRADKTSRVGEEKGRPHDPTEKEGE